MGAGQSTQAGDQVISAPEPSTSVQFSPSLVSRLSSPATEQSTEKHSSTDEIVRRRLAAESAHIRAQEAEILQSISAALEKENLDREKPGMSSEVLGRDIEEVREKVERMRKERAAREGEGVQRAREGVVRCYKEKSDRPLDCWKEVEAFKQEVGKLEQAFVKSLQ
ncbi:hypothetical protein DB88DRAFT_496731 [Papiliotrema laurentii]|uniref:MICOS complex subunit mic19 n=1 Tax=Papiliotrema laurentii TaxID=5418 RepID=A0AAD9CWF9_PAPLA|nr:hypothetical protein DB88DRAFT_496731 [Papiliotrema laurentii]